MQLTRLRWWPLVFLAGCAGPEVSEPINNSEALDASRAAVIYAASHIQVVSDSAIPATGGVASARHENCLVPNQDLNGDGILDPIPPRTQLLIYRGATLRGVCTVVGPSGSPNILMTQTGFRNRVDIDADFDVNGSIDLDLDGNGTDDETNQTLTLPTVRSNFAGAAGANWALPALTTPSVAVVTGGSANSLVELYKPQSAPKVLYTWPHLMENGTLAQLQAMDAATGARTWETLWGAGFNNAQRTHHELDRFHITSANLQHSWPALSLHTGAGGTRMPYAVSFHTHGASCASSIAVRVGGQNGDLEEQSMHRGVAEVIRMAFPDSAFDDGSRITYKWGDCFDGDGPENFVNAASAFSNGIQLEQYFGWITANHDGVQTRGPVVAAAVRSVFDCLSEPADASSAPWYYGNVTSGGTGYHTSGLCPGFIADVDITHAWSAAHAMYPGIQNCPANGGANGRAHVDLYREQTAAGGQKRWYRIGGGRMDYDASCNPTLKVLNTAGIWETNSTLFNPTAADTTVNANQTVRFRAVIRAFKADGTTPLPAFFNVSG
ncbi:hypothetical protein K8640_35355 [Myxococcus sp. XM-1-1-1]|uniref:hypothetical protein n=1 Tax=Myxococcus sp. XM-1-1-1 TaxID=2874602 RepID=UPI001CBDAC09|nr:hypothetical protein [Myxococcus sp. XM-1-1-1]MBZ4413514.1 hypothetical protein [Myxococcus sp. XM-1-1-1]